MFEDSPERSFVKNEDTCVSEESRTSEDAPSVSETLPKAVSVRGAYSAAVTDASSSGVSVMTLVKKSEGGRVYNKRFYCLYCSKAVSKMARHLGHKHKSEPEVERAFTFPKGSQERRIHLRLLTNRGNYAHNIQVLREGRGLTIPVKQSNGPVNASDYVHCFNCEAFLKRKFLWRHMQTCEKRIRREADRSTFHDAWKALPTQHLNSDFLKLLQEMHRDQVMEAVCGDGYVLKLGEELFLKHAHNARKRDYSKQRMRDAGRLLLQGWTTGKLQTITDFVLPTNFPSVIRAVRHVAGLDRQTNSCKMPSLLIKLRYILKRVALLVEREAASAGDMTTVNNMMVFRKMCDSQWVKWGLALQGVMHGMELQAVASQATASQAIILQAETSQGMSLQAETSQCMTSQAETIQGVASQAETFQGMPSQAATLQGGASQAEMLQGMSSQSTASQAITLQAETSQGMSSQAETSQCVASQAETSQCVASQAATLQGVASQAIMLQPLVAQDLTLQGVALQAVTLQGVALHAVTLQGVASQALAVQDLSDLTSQSVASQGVASQNMVPQAVTLQGVVVQGRTSHGVVSQAKNARWKVPQLCVFAKDVRTIHQYLNAQRKELQSMLGEEPSQERWEELAKLTLCEVMLFNGHSDKKVSKMPLTALSDEVDLDQDVTRSKRELILRKNFIHLQIRDGNAQNTAVFVTTHTLASMKLLVTTRLRCGVPQENHFLFAYPQYLGHLSGSDAIRHIAQKCGIKHAVDMASGKLRTHTAAMLLVLVLQDMDRLTELMGPGPYISYQDATRQLAWLSKVLLALDEGQSLDTVHFHHRELVRQDIKASEVVVVKVPPSSSSTERIQEVKVSVPPSSSASGRRKRKWTKEEAEAVEKTLMHYITRGKVPRKAPCVACIKSSPNALSSRTWSAVKFYVKNRIEMARRDSSRTQR